MTRALEACRSCGASDLEVVLSLGRTPLANSLPAAADLDRPDPVHPLDLAFCAGCGLVQITETVPPETLFREYLYFSSYSDTMLRHARDLVSEMIASRSLGERSLAVEIASNDGYLLQYYRERGVPVLGIEPARNIARAAEEIRGVRTISEFFGLELASELAAEGRRADVLHAHNVLAHVPDLNGFVKGIGVLLKDDGVAVVEVPYVKEMIDRTEYDTIYHEHLCYFSLTSLERLVRRHGLAVAGVRRLPIHGGSLRLIVERAAASKVREAASRPGSSVRPDASGSPESVRALLEEEDAWGARDAAFYRGFAARVEALRRSLRRLLEGLKGRGKRIAAYGAAAKGSTLLNTLGLPPGTIEFVADRNPHKQGRFMPGVRIPIVSPDRILESMPDYLLVLAWNLADEIREQQQEYVARGGRLILPLPEPRVLDPIPGEARA